jgi:hypothetical protein
MNAISSHGISHANYLNLDAYIVVRQGPWWSDYNLFVDVHFLFECPKVALNSSTNASKLFSIEINASPQAQTTLFYAW